MCGLFAVVNREKVLMEYNKFTKLFSQGLYCTALRGVDGTGVLSVTDKGMLDIYKRGLAPADFIEITKAKKIMENNNNVFLIGHARSSTVGANTCENAHPFTRKHIHLFHNGTLRTHQHLHKNLDVRVDSDSIASAISECDTREEVVTILEKLNGAYSLIWYDSEDGTLSFARNNERPLFKATFEGSTSEVYASEPGMLIWLAGRVGLKVEAVTPTSVGNYITIGQKADEIIETPFKPQATVVYDYSEYYPRSRHNSAYNTAVGDACELPAVKTKEVTAKIGKKSNDDEKLIIMTVKLGEEDLKLARSVKTGFSFKGSTAINEKVTLNCKNIDDRNAIFGGAPYSDMYVVAYKNCHFENNGVKIISVTYLRGATTHEISRFLVNKQKHEDISDMLLEDDEVFGSNLTLWGEV